ncbi:MAG TPA: mandelate racemase/muconate lactonizing enzyme family protein [Candidatus Tectomicrobia bacterium]|nr:mandelate racemase/muconate lactonizing enzyme family protein [Candidatus Tectomicrobia bacterium]
MKIADLRVHVLSAPVHEPIRMAHGTLRTRPAVLVEIVTADGATGWGESWVNFPPWAWRERVATLTEGVRPLLLGVVADDREGLRRRLHDTLVPMARQWGALGPVMQAISAVDIALWDLAGRVAGQPVAHLLGGDAGAPLPAYASGLGPARAVAQAERAVAAGFTALKLKIGFDWEADRANIAAVRRTVGPGITLMVDANQAWTVAETLARGPWLAEQGVRWLEEPVPSGDAHDLRQVTGKAGVPIAAGENVYTVCGFRRLLEARAVDVAQPDVAKTGGLSEMASICRLAGAHGVPWAPHFYGGALGMAATLHAFAAFPGGVAVEWDWNENPLRDALLRRPFEVRDGAVTPPAGPGLGVEIDPAALRRFAVSA